MTFITDPAFGDEQARCAHAERTRRAVENLPAIEYQLDNRDPEQPFTERARDHVRCCQVLRAAKVMPAEEAAEAICDLAKMIAVSTFVASEGRLPDDELVSDLTATVLEEVAEVELAYLLKNDRDELARIIRAGREKLDR